LLLHIHQYQKIHLLLQNILKIYLLLKKKYVEKLEYLLQEYGKNQLDKEEVCCHQNTPCVNNNKEKLSYNILPVRGNRLQAKGDDKDNVDYSHKGKNSDSQIKEQLGKSNKEQQKILLNKENSRQNIIDFIINNKDSIRIEDLKISEPFYKCYREKGNCIICNSLSNIICTNCCNSHEEIWLCINHWKQHAIENHHQKGEINFNIISRM
jgi:hypothetical protein